MKTVTQHIELLGQRAKDCVTEFTGVVTSISFDLYGCVQAWVSPGLDKDGNPREGRWFDASRLRFDGTDRVMPVPDFIGPGAGGLKGPAEKSAPQQQ